MYKFEQVNPIYNQVEHLKKIIFYLKEEHNETHLLVNHLESSISTFNEGIILLSKRKLEIIKYKQRICDIDLELISKKSMLSTLEEKMALDAKELLDEFEDAKKNYSEIKEKSNKFICESGTNEKNKNSVHYINRIEYLKKECDLCLSLIEVNKNSNLEQNYKGAFMFFLTTLCIEYSNATGKTLI